MIKKKGGFYFNWVLVNQLAVGSLPKSEDDFNFLINKNIKLILTLCDPQEGEIPFEFKKKFRCESFILPDHKSKRFPKKIEIDGALIYLRR